MRGHQTHSVCDIRYYGGRVILVTNCHTIESMKNASGAGVGAYYMLA
jgi:hypothetical protein